MAAVFSDTEVAVIGGGLVGTAIAVGLSRRGFRTTILDEDDRAYRAARGNFALVWVQGKGLGMPGYAHWTKSSANSWSALAADLARETDVDVAFQQPGGLAIALSEDELQRRSDRMLRLHNQNGADDRYDVLDRRQVEAMLPQIGPDVAGAIYCPSDGHVNSLKLFRALHIAFARNGGVYKTEASVTAITPGNGGFRITTRAGSLEAEKVVLAAGLGNAALAPMIGMTAPVRPLRGQIVVTERLKNFLNYPIGTLRQTDEGSVMIGDSQEESGDDHMVRTAVNATMANRAVRTFPLLANARVVRTWSALRVMTQDGFPIYDQSPQHPGAFVATCHSGVTLAANHAGSLADAIAAGQLPPELAVFSARRFDVQKAG